MIYRLPLIVTLSFLCSSFFAAPCGAQFEPPPVPKMTMDEAIAAIRSEGKSLRYLGALALEAKGPKAKDAVPVIIGLLRDQGLLERQELLHVLVAIGEPAADAVPDLTEGLSNDDFHVRYLCCRALGNIGKSAKPAVQPLIAKLKDSNPSVRRNAAMALAKLGPEIAPDAVAPLVEMMKDAVHPAREQAVLAVGEFGELAKFAIPELKALMDADNCTVRAQAARSMWKLTGDAELAKPALLQVVRNGDVDGAAAMILAEMGAIDDLIALLNSEPENALSVMEALGSLGPKAKPAIPALRKLSLHPEAYVREEAQAAIARIEAEQKSEGQEDK